MKNNKKVIITGVTGQDGSYLAEYLLKKKYKVYGIVRRSSVNNLERLEYLGIKNRINFLYSDIQEHQTISNFIKTIKPDMFFNLASQSFVTYSYENPIYTDLVNNTSTINMLETIRYFSNKTKFYQASSSEMYGNTRYNSRKIKLDEKSIFEPISPYAIAKLSSYFYTKMYRQSHNVFACNGILFNHESPLRGDNFVTKKIVKNLVKIFYGIKKDSLRLGNIYAKRDWGDAREYVRVMFKILNTSQPDDYVISTEKQYSVKEFINRVTKKLNMSISWRGKGLNEVAVNKKGKIIIKISKKYFRYNDVKDLLGSSSKAKKKLKWKVNCNIDKLINDMISYEKDQLNIN